MFTLTVTFDANNNTLLPSEVEGLTTIYERWAANLALSKNNCVQWLNVVCCNLHSCILVRPEVHTLFTYSILVYGAQLGIEMMTCLPAGYAACYLRMTQHVLVHI